MSSARRRTVEQPSSARQQQQQQQQHTGRSTYSSMASGRTDASVLLPGEARTSAQRVEQHRLRQGGISFNVDLNERISPRRVTKGRVHSVDEHPPQYVEWSVPSPSSRHSGDRPPTAEERQRALTARPPPPREVVYASRRSWRRFFQRLWSWLSISALLACIFGGRGRRRRDAAPPSSPSPPVAQQPQQQTCIDDEDPGSPSSDRVSDSDRRLVAALNRLSLPLWMQRALFYIIDFLTKRRVVFVAAVVAVIVMIGITVPTTEVLGNVASVFQIAEDDRPGLRFRETYMRGREHLPHKHPVVVMPGFITSALEVWEDNLPCLRNNTSIFTSGFRQRMFGTQLLLLILKDPQCWLDLFRLDPNTGRDPRGVKIRPDSGFTSVDYFMPGFWVWARILVNLADIGYDPQSMAVLTYDWRLSPTVLHDRDGYFFQVRNNVKFLCQKNRERAVMIAHSYGALVTLAFLKWTEQREPGWMDRYVAYFINIGGTTMGIPKTVLASLVGDVRDSLDVPRPARSMLDSFVSRRKRTDFTRTWSCLVAMMPRGCSDAFPDLLVLPNGTALDMRSSAELLRRECGESGHRDCVAQVDAHLAEMEELPVLPHAPNSTVVCLYGVNKATETGYRINAEDLEQTSTGADAVLLGDGDGTVPLASLAYMCRAPNGWKKNVGRVVTVEYRHGEDATSMLKMRGGSGSGDHVDILGNHDLIETVLKIVSGVDEEGAKNDGICDVDPITGESRIIHRRVHDRITSNIDAHIQHNMGSCLAKQNHRILRTHIQKDEEKFLR